MKAIGGHDVCETCAAHCVALEDADRRIRALEAELARTEAQRDNALRHYRERQDETIALSAQIRALEDVVKRRENLLRNIAAEDPNWSVAILNILDASQSETKGEPK